MEDVLASYAYKLESPGALLAGEMIEDMIEVCNRLNGSLYEQITEETVIGGQQCKKKWISLQNGRVRNSNDLSHSNIISN